MMFYVEILSNCAIEGFALKPLAKPTWTAVHCEYDLLKNYSRQKHRTDEFTLMTLMGS
jgi:hypothetical protein